MVEPPLKYSLWPAYEGDLPFVFYCRNDPTTRLMSTRQHFIEWDEIKNWNVMIFSHGRRHEGFPGGRVGYGRVNQPAAEQPLVEISYVIAPEMRGRGHGTELVKALISQTPPSFIISAEIKTNNGASQACARKAGMTLIGMGGELERWTFRKP